VKYLLIIHNNPALLESLSPAELDAMVGAHEPFQAALLETGELVGFAALTDLSQARVVRRPAGGARSSPTALTWRPRSTWPASTWSTARRRSGRPSWPRRCRRPRTAGSRCGR
jgi:hypothetical protein